MSKPQLEDEMLIDDPEAYKDVKKKRLNARDQELEDMKAIMNTPQGVRFISRILEKGFVFRPTFTGNSQTFFNEGMRNLALMILADVTESCPEKIPDVLMRQ